MAVASSVDRFAADSHSQVPTAHLQGGSNMSRSEKHDTGTAFDRALQNLRLIADTDAYAAQHGEPGTDGYRAAWLEYRARMRDTGAGREPQPRPTAPDVDPDGVLQAAVLRALQIDGAAMADAQLVDASVDGLRLVAHHGFKPAFVDRFEVVDDTATACGVALASARPVWVADITRSGIFAGKPGLDVMLDAGSRAVASLPLLSANRRPIGMLSVHHDQPITWTAQRKLRLGHLARSAGLLLHRVVDANPSE
jgi:GAF domain